MGPSEETAMEAELRRVERELVIVTQERDILKKVIAIFSQEGHRGISS